MLFAVLSVVCSIGFLIGCDQNGESQMSNYYIDSENGDDSANGRSESSAWRSLEALEEREFSAGDTINLKGSFEGSLQFKGSGTADSPITVKSYGNKKAVIDAKGVSSAVIIKNQDYITLTDVEICNRAVLKVGQVLRSGVNITCTEDRVMYGIQILNCDIHDVYGVVANPSGSNGQLPNGFSNAGILIKHTATPVAGKNGFDGILIQGCTLTDVKCEGIRSVDGYKWVKGDDAMTMPPESMTYTFKNLVIKDTVLERTGMDGICIGCAYKPLVENVKCFDAGYWSNETTLNIAGVWSFSSYSATFRNVEVARTRYINGDGQAFDTDWGNSGEFLWEYCYTHDNEGGLLLRHWPMKGVFRYCVSINDENPNKKHNNGDRVGQEGLIHFATMDTGFNKSKGDGDCVTHFYNCVFYMDNGNMEISKAHGQYNAVGKYYSPAAYDIDINKFTNCVFVSKNQVNWGNQMQFSHNAYYNMSGASTAPSRDSNAVKGNPKFVSAVTKDADGYIEDRSDPATFFMLEFGSPLIDRGAPIANNGGRDYSGKALNVGVVSIGAFEP